MDLTTFAFADFQEKENSRRLAEFYEHSNVSYFFVFSGEKEVRQFQGVLREKIISKCLSDKLESSARELFELSLLESNTG